MKRIALRCRSCGWAGEVAAQAVPRAGARPRCPRCDSLLPLLGPPGAAPEADPAIAREAASAAAGSAPEVDAARAGEVAPEAGGTRGPTRAEAQEIIRLWLRELHRARGRPLDAAALRGDHAADLARLETLWNASYPGPEAQKVLEEELRHALEREARGGGAD